MPRRAPKPSDPRKPHPLRLRSETIAAIRECVALTRLALGRRVTICEVLRKSVVRRNAYLRAQVRAMGISEDQIAEAKRKAFCKPPRESAPIQRKANPAPRVD